MATHAALLRPAEFGEGTGGHPYVATDEFTKGTGQHKTPTPWLVRVEKEQKWWRGAVERLENEEYYSLAA